MSYDGLARYSFTLPAASGSWIYSPGRDIDPGWTAAYTGTPNILDSADKQGKGYMYFRTTTANHTKISLEFNGVRLHMCIQSNGAKYQLTIDGKPLSLSGLFNSPRCRAMGASSTLSTDILPHTVHLAELTVLEASEAEEARVFGGVVDADINVGHVLLEFPNWINTDDLDSRWVYSPQLGLGNWGVIQDDRAYKQSYTLDCNYDIGETVSISFKDASAVLLWGFLYQDTHFYSVEFNGTIFNADASTSMWRVGSTPIFLQTGLDPSKEYTITYRNFNTEFPDCTSGRWLGRNTSRTCCGSLDALQLWGSMSTLRDGSFVSGTARTTTSTTLSSGPASGETSALGEPSQAGLSSGLLIAIAGAVVGGVIFISLFGLVLCWRWRRNRRRVPEVGPGQPAPLVSEESLAIHRDVVRPWVDDMQDHNMVYYPSPVPVPVHRHSAMNKVSQWAAKPSTLP